MDDCLSRAPCLKQTRVTTETGWMSGMSGESWLCPTELDRSRVVAATERGRAIRRVGSGAVGAALVISAPWIGWWTLILFALSALNFWHVDRTISKSVHPE